MNREVSRLGLLRNALAPTLVVATFAVAVHANPRANEQPSVAPSTSADEGQSLPPNLPSAPPKAEPPAAPAPAPAEPAPAPAEPEPAAEEPTPAEPPVAEPTPAEPAGGDEPIVDTPPSAPEAPATNDAANAARLEARAAMRSGRYEAAIAAWSELLRNAPGDEEASRGLARAEADYIHPCGLEFVGTDCVFVEVGDFLVCGVAGPITGQVPSGQT